MAQGRCEEALATPHSRGREQQQPRETGGSGRGGSLADAAVDECRNEVANRVARYQFDKLNRVCAVIALIPLQQDVVSALFSLNSKGGARKRQ